MNVPDGKTTSHNSSEPMGLSTVVDSLNPGVWSANWLWGIHFNLWSSLDTSMDLLKHISRQWHEPSIFNLHSKFTTYLSPSFVFWAANVDTDGHSLCCSSYSINLVIMNVLWLAISNSTRALIGVCPFELNIETIASAVAPLLQRPEVSEQHEH